MILSPEMNRGKKAKQWSNGQTFDTDVRTNFDHYKAVVREVFVYSHSTPKRKQCPLTRGMHIIITYGALYARTIRLLSYRLLRKQSDRQIVSCFST